MNVWPTCNLINDWSRNAIQRSLICPEHAMFFTDQVCDIVWRFEVKQKIMHFVFVLQTVRGRIERMFRIIRVYACMLFLQESHSF